jgi:hypothetical protein
MLRRYRMWSNSGGAIPPREGRVAAKRPGGENPPYLAGFSPPPRFRADPPLAGRDETTRVAGDSSHTLGAAA